MATPSVIKDNDSGVTAKVTKFGQLVVAPLQYSIPVADEVDVANIAFNFIGPEQDQSIVITDIVLSADRNVGVNGADIVIYEADSPTTLPSTWWGCSTCLPSVCSGIVYSHHQF